jgi:hypothetical protein
LGAGLRERCASKNNQTALDAAYQSGLEVHHGLALTSDVSILGHLSVQSLATYSENARRMRDISLGRLQRLFHGGLGKVFQVGGNARGNY